MKLKFLLVLFVVLGFVFVGCTSMTKSLIYGESKLQWITPSESECKNNGGKIEEGMCIADKLDAEEVCRATGGTLPSFYELERVVTDCGESSSKILALPSSSYLSCKKKKGFGNNRYWSSEQSYSIPTHINLINFRTARKTNAIPTMGGVAVRCVRVSQTKDKVQGSFTKNKVQGKWITPSRSNCGNYGGHSKRSVCKATWSKAKEICRASGGILASLDDLQDILIDCGGSEQVNSNYKACLESKGFEPTHYWSSLTETNRDRYAWYVNFKRNKYHFAHKNNKFAVRCIAGQ